MFYSDEIIEEVRERNDIVDVISSYVKLKKTGSNYVGLCPFHNEKTPSFSVSQRKQMYYCFGCGAGGNVFTFLMEYENYTFVEALKFLAERAGMDLPEQQVSSYDKQLKDLRSRILDVNKEAAIFYYAKLKTPKGQDAYAYLKNRQLTDETITHFGLGYSGKSGGELYSYLRKKGLDDNVLKQSGLFTFSETKGVMDKFWNRVMFPILDRNSRVIAFGGRVMGDGMPKYLNSPETPVFDKSRNLYGMNVMTLKKGQPLIICEGYMDVIAMHQAGFTNTVASLGTAFTGLQANLMKRYTDTVYLCYDSDGAGVKATLRAIPILKEAGLSIKVLQLSPYKDPDEFMKNLGQEEFVKRMEEAKISFFFEVEVMEKEYDMANPEQKTKFMNEVAKKCLQFEQEIERNNYMEAFSRQYSIRYEDFRKLVLHHAAKMVGMKPREPVNRNISHQKKDEQPIYKVQKLLLTWLCEETSLFEKIKEYVLPDDFLDEPYHKVAEMLYEQYRETGEVFPAKIISCFEEKEEQKEVASLFNTSIDSQLESRDREKALNDIVVRIKKHSLDEQSRNVKNLEELPIIIAKKQELQKLHISL